MKFSKTIEGNTMEIDINRFVEVEFGKNQLVITRTLAIPGVEERNAVLIATRSGTTDDPTQEPTPTSGLLLFFPTDEQAARVHAALLNL